MKFAETLRFVQSVRGRVALFGTLIMAVFLAVAGLTFDRTLRNARYDELARAAEARLELTCEATRNGSLAMPISAPRDSVLLVQVIDETTTVLAATANVMDMEKPFVDSAQYAASSIAVSRWTATIDGGSYLLVGRRVAGLNPMATVYVAAPLSDVDRLSQSLRRQLLWWVPLFLLVTAGGLLLVVGRALRPVEVLRRQVASIEADDLSRRVELPGVNDEVGRLAVTMNEMLHRVESASQRQDRFVSDASHELRTPLSVIRTRLEVGLRNPSRTDWLTTGSALLDQNTRMERLVSNLLTLAKGRAAAAPIKLSVDLDDVVRSVAQDARVLSPTLTVDLSKVSAGRVTGDPDLLRQVVQNLVDNARTHATSQVSIELRTTETTVALAVEDDGVGVPVEERDRVFDRFTRLDSSRTSSSGGAGLGLAIVAEIVLAHDGTIAFVDPVLLGGARAVVNFPIE
jgi:signal transduction histidine kinase